MHEQFDLFSHPKADREVRQPSTTKVSARDATEMAVFKRFIGLQAEQEYKGLSPDQLSEYEHLYERFGRPAPMRTETSLDTTLLNVYVAENGKLLGPFVERRSQGEGWPDVIVYQDSPSQRVGVSADLAVISR